MTKLSRRIAMMFGVTLALVPLLLFAYLGVHHRLMLDDYGYLGLPAEIGTWRAMLFWREVWNGDYSNFLLYGLLARLGITAPPLFSLFLCASALVGFGWAARTVLAHLEIRSHQRAIIVALASLTTAATINGFYHPQAYYWLSAAVEYTWPAVMLLLGMALAVETGRRLRGRVQHLLAAIAAALYAFINAGFSEMHLSFQLSVVALIAIYVHVFERGPRRKSYVILALAACLGTIASLPAQMSSPGIAFRSSLSEVYGTPVLPVRGLPALSGRALEATVHYAGHEASFAGFMLVVFAGLFLTLSLPPPPRIDSKPLKTAAAAEPIVFALAVQLLFMPILWSHQSDNVQVFGRFSYAFMVVVCLNLLALTVLLALLWRRDLLDKALDRRNGLAVYCGGTLLFVCLLFAMTQAQSIHFKASSYLYFTAVASLIMLAWQLTRMGDEPRMKGVFRLGAFATASAVITLAALVMVNLWGVGYFIDRTFTAVTFTLMLAGLLNGLALGASIQRGFCMTGASAFWLRTIRLFCLLVALTIAIGIVIGQERRISHTRQDAESWDATHQEIIRLRDAGDPTVYMKSFTRMITRPVWLGSPRYQTAPLIWSTKLFYGLELSRNSECSFCPKVIDGPVYSCARAEILVSGKAKAMAWQDPTCGEN